MGHEITIKILPKNFISYIATLCVAGWLALMLFAVCSAGTYWAIRFIGLTFFPWVVGALK